jgi:hypothetical protein
MVENEEKETKAPTAKCFITGCRKNGTTATEATMPGGVKIDVNVCEEHYESMQEAAAEKIGKGAGVCHICNQPVGVVDYEFLRSNPDLVQNEKAMVSWWIHADKPRDEASLCHEQCRCTERYEVGYTRARTEVAVPA